MWGFLGCHISVLHFFHVFRFLLSFLSSISYPFGMRHTPRSLWVTAMRILRTIMKPTGSTLSDRDPGPGFSSAGLQVPAKPLKSWLHCLPIRLLAPIVILPIILGLWLHDLLPFRREHEMLQTINLALASPSTALWHQDEARFIFFLDLILLILENGLVLLKER